MIVGVATVDLVEGKSVLVLVSISAAVCIHELLGLHEQDLSFVLGAHKEEVSHRGLSFERLVVCATLREAS